MTTPGITSNASAASATSGAASPVSPPAKDTSTVGVAAKAKAQMNSSIVEAALTVSLNSPNQSLSVVLKTALTGINEALKNDFGEHAIEHAVAQDNTPEGTASRIVALSTAFYDAYRQQHPQQDEQTVLDQFMATLQRGVDQGFKEARGVLEGLKVLNGEVASNIDKTYQLVQQGYADFAAAHAVKTAAPAQATQPTPS